VVAVVVRVAVAVVVLVAIVLLLLEFLQVVVHLLKVCILCPLRVTLSRLVVAVVVVVVEVHRVVQALLLPLSV
jgi:hypothetical protein